MILEFVSMPLTEHLAYTQADMQGQTSWRENIRQTDAIVHVVRAFDDDDITTVSGKVDPIEDIDTINLELVMADLDAVNKRLGKVQRAAKGRDKDALAELAVLNKIKPVLEDGKSVRSIDFSDDETRT